MTYAEYLNTMTVKTLHAIAQRMALKGHSRFRKADLITLIDNAIATDWRHEAMASWPATDADRVAACLTYHQPTPATANKQVKAVAPVVFSTQPALMNRIREAAPKPASQVAVADTGVTLAESFRAESTSELIDMARNMRATLHTLVGKVHARTAVKLAALEKVLKSRGIDLLTLTPAKRNRAWRK